MTNFGKFARERVKRLGKSQKELASELGVSPAYISQVLSGKKNPPDLGRPRSRAQLRKWSRCLAAGEEIILEIVRYDLHCVPPRPSARFPVMRELLLARLSPSAKELGDEICGMSLHPAENLGIRTLVHVYLAGREGRPKGRADGARRFRELALGASADRDFVESELTDHFREEPFVWSWDPDSNEVCFAWESDELRDAMQRAVEILTDSSAPLVRPTIPLVGHVSAGDGFEYTDGGFVAGEGFDQVDIPPGLDGRVASRLYCVRVRGDSLRDFLCDGALLFIKPESWEEVRDGDLVIFKDRNNQKAFVKKVEFAGESLILKPMNSLYKNMVLRKTDLMLLERVMAIVL